MKNAIVLPETDPLNEDEPFDVQGFLDTMKSMQNVDQESPLFLFGDISEVNYGMFMLQLSRAEQDLKEKARSLDEIVIKLTSSGGHAGLGFGLYDALRLSPLKTTVQCYGYCSSAAVLPLMAADVRLSSKYCYFLLHEVFISTDEPQSMNKKDLMSHHNELKVLHDNYCAILAKRSKQPISVIKKLCKDETTLSAKQALKLNLIDGII